MNVVRLERQRKLHAAIRFIESERDAALVRVAELEHSLATCESERTALDGIVEGLEAQRDRYRAALEWRVSHIDLKVGGHRITWGHDTEEKARQEVRNLRDLAVLANSAIQDIRLERREVGAWEVADA